MSPADALRAFLTSILQDGGWRIQFGRWVDDPTNGRAYRYAVIKPMGGLPASLIREPKFTLSLIASASDVATLPDTTAQAVIAAMATSSGALVSLQPGEPVFWSTDDGRPASDLSINTIVNAEG